MFDSLSKIIITSAERTEILHREKPYVARLFHHYDYGEIICRCHRFFRFASSLRVNGFLRQTDHLPPEETEKKVANEMWKEIECTTDEY